MKKKEEEKCYEHSFDYIFVATLNLLYNFRRKKERRKSTNTVTIMTRTMDIACTKRIRIIMITTMNTGKRNTKVTRKSITSTKKNNEIQVDELKIHSVIKLCNILLVLMVLTIVKYSILAIALVLFRLQEKRCWKNYVKK